jgi:lipopolysaccharide biosynthesis glycosyltransferase
MPKVNDKVNKGDRDLSFWQRLKIVALGAIIVSSYTASWMTATRSSKIAANFSSRVHQHAQASKDQGREQQPPIHIVLALSGNNPGFFGEFKVALKSIILSAPHNRDTHVHIISDQKAYDYLPTVWEDTKVDGMEWWRNVTIFPYNVESQLPQWATVLKNRTDMDLSGAYYRLFANKVLPTHVEYALYLDVDVIVLANLNHLFQDLPHDLESLEDKPLMIMAGGEDGGCSGVMLVNIAKLDKFWEHVNSMNWTGKELPYWDQSMIMEVGKQYPGSVQYLAFPWDLTVTEHWREIGRIEKVRPEAGIIHYNGNGGDVPFYSSGFVNDTQRGMGLPATYFRDLPWTWVRFMGKSVGGPTNTGVRIIQGSPNATVIVRFPAKAIVLQSEYQSERKKMLNSM